MFLLLFLLTLFAGSDDAERLKQLGVGGFILITVLAMVFAFILKWRSERVADAPKEAGKPSFGYENGIKSGDRPVDYWQRIFAEIVEKCTKPISDKQDLILMQLAEIRTMLEALLERRRNQRR